MLKTVVKIYWVSKLKMTIISWIIIIINLLKTFKDKLQAFVTNDPDSGYQLTLIEDLCKHLQKTVKSIPETLDEFYKDIATKNDDKLLLLVEAIDKDLAKYYKYLIVLREDLLIENMLKKHEWLSSILADRTLFKLALMTSVYNATKYGRRGNFYDFLHDKIQTQVLSRKEKKFLVQFFEKTFNQFMRKKMPENTLMFALGAHLAKKGKPIVIRNKFFKITIAPYKTKDVSLQTVSIKYKRGQQITLHIPIKEIDIIELIKCLPANFIHSMDALIIHLLRERLGPLLDFGINYSTNHDSYFGNIPLYLKHLVKDCYSELYNMNYITTLEALTEEEAESFLKRTIKSFVINNYFLS